MSVPAGRKPTCLDRLRTGAGRRYTLLQEIIPEVGLTSSLVLLFLLGAMLAWIAYDEYTATRQAEYRLLEANARNAETKVSGALLKIERLLEQMASEQSRQPARTVQAYRALIEHYRDDLPDHGEILLTDAAGRVCSSTSAALVGRDVSRASFFRQHLLVDEPQRMFMSRPEKTLLGEMAVVFSLPVIGPRQQFLGVVGITIGYRFFPSVLQTINPDDSASMSVIFNREGDLLFRRGEPERFFGYNIVKISTVFHEHFQQGARSTRHLGPSAHDGQMLLFVARDVGDTGLGLILSRRLADVMENWRRNVLIYVLIFLFTAAVMLLFELGAARRKRELRLAKDFTDQLVATANVLLVGLDRRGAVTIFNETAVRISGYASDEVLGREWLNLVVPRGVFRDIAAQFQPFIDGGALPHSLDYPILTRNGEIRLISWQNSVLETPRMAICFGIDVTERKEMELRLSEAKRVAEEANAAKSKFLAAASHDLRQPVHALGLFLELLGRSSLNADQQGMLAAARSAAQASANMLNTLLDFSRIEAGVIVPQRRPFALQPMLTKIESELAPQADARHLIFRVRETPVTVFSDPGLVELILRNLVANAIRYTEHGGLLVGCRYRGGQVVVEVWDTGIGIPLADQQEVFREFHQLGNPERDRRKGFGLGLAICRGLANTLQHRLSLRSLSGRGSVFRLTLPVVVGSSVAVESEADAGDDLPLLLAIAPIPYRVLVIDDDEAVRQGTLQLLQDWGCTGWAVESLEEVQHLPREAVPDLIISDYRLREQCTGAQAIAVLREQFGPDLPAILITGDTAPERLAEARASGIPLLHKPLAPAQLQRLVAQLLFPGRETPP